jgi:hypothetical protein
MYVMFVCIGGTNHLMKNDRASPDGLEQSRGVFASGNLCLEAARVNPFKAAAALFQWLCR